MTGTTTHQIAPRERVQAIGTTWWVAFGALVVVAVRVWAGRRARAIEIVADEPGYLAMARGLAGVGVEWNLGVGATYSPAYSFLLAPIYRVTEDPETIYRAAIGVNALLGAVTFVLLWAFARRLTPLSPRGAVVAAAALSVAPAVSGHVNWAWGENLAVPAYLAFALACVVLAERPTPGRALAAAALGPFAYLTHGRFLPCLVVLVGVLVVLMARRRLPVVGGAAALAVLTAGVLLARVISHAMADPHFEPNGAVDQTTYNLERATRVTKVLVEVVGQSWYLIATTAGLAGLGVLVLARSAMGRRAVAGDGTGGETVSADDGPIDEGTWPGVLRSDAVVLLFLSAVAVATSMAFMADRSRPDQLIYGRYNDAVIGPVVLAGLGWLLVRRPWTRTVAMTGAVLAGLAATGGALYAVRADELGRPGFTRPNVLGLIPFNGDAPGIRLLHSSALAVGVILLVAAAALVASHLADRSPRALLLPLAVVVLLAVAGLVRTDRVIRYDITRLDQGRVIAALGEDVLRPGEVLRYRWNPIEPTVPITPFYELQFHLPDNPFVLDPPWRDPPDTPFVFDVVTSAELTEAGGRLLYIDPNNGVALWILPGPRQDELAAAGALIP